MTTIFQRAVDRMFNPPPAADRLHVTKNSREALLALVTVQRQQIEQLTKERDSWKAEYEFLKSIF